MIFDEIFERSIINQIRRLVSVKGEVRRGAEPNPGRSRRLCGSAIALICPHFEQSIVQRREMV
jgi:hypothetical protein